MPGPSRSGRKVAEGLRLKACTPALLIAETAETLKQLGTGHWAPVAGSHGVAKVAKPKTASDVCVLLSMHRGLLHISKSARTVLQVCFGVLMYILLYAIIHE